MRRLLSLLSAASAAIALGGCAGSACSCDIIQSDSRCVEFSAPDNPLYATQLSTTCNVTLSQLCDTLGGTYTFGTPCPEQDLSGDCLVDVVSYRETVHWYSTGGDPVLAGDTTPEDDCSDNGVVTRY